MDFELSDEQKMLRDTSRELLADRSPIGDIRGRSDDAPDVDPDLWRFAAELGWTGLALPGEHGGSDQGLTELAIVAEEIGRALARGPFLPSMLVGNAITRGGPVALQAEVLPELAAGAAWASWAVAEPRSPWTLAGVRTTAVPDGDDVVLRGVKSAVQDAGGARWLLVTARLDGEPLSYLLDRDTPGLTVRRQRTLDLTRALYEVRLDGVRVPATRRLSGGATESQRLLDEAAVLTCAESLGVAGRLLEMTVEYVKTRVQFGRPIGGFQAVKHKCATMAMLVLGSRAATYAAAMAADGATPDAGRAACAAKAFVADTVSRVGGEALQLHGGIGFTWEHDLHLYLRRGQVDAVLYGDAAVHRHRLCDLIQSEPTGTPA
jgi:alkylation response protein AidB-like acyl-CoA dehydrogenase